MHLPVVEESLHQHHLLASKDLLQMNQIHTPGKRAISISPLHSLVQQLLSVVAALPPLVQQTHKSQQFLHKVIYIKGYVVNKLHAEQPEYAARERQG
jgi:hypothetical protein